MPQSRTSSSALWSCPYIAWHSCTLRLGDTSLAKFAGTACPAGAIWPAGCRGSAASASASAEPGCPNEVLTIVDHQADHRRRIIPERSSSSTFCDTRVLPRRSPRNRAASPTARRRRRNEQMRLQQSARRTAPTPTRDSKTVLLSVRCSSTNQLSYMPARAAPRLHRSLQTLLIDAFSWLRWDVLWARLDHSKQSQPPNAFCQAVGCSEQSPTQSSPWGKEGGGDGGPKGGVNGGDGGSGGGGALGMGGGEGDGDAIGNGGRGVGDGLGGGGGWSEMNWESSEDGSWLRRLSLA